MRWYLNDASFQGQFDVDQFVAALDQVLLVRGDIREAGGELYVGLGAPSLPATGNLLLRDVVNGQGDVDRKRRIVSWFDKAGPFIEADRAPQQEDYFECFGVDVTNGGLGEAARRAILGQASSSFGLEGGEVDFCQTPLPVVHGLPEVPFGIVSIPNYWSRAAARQALVTELGYPTSWKTLVEYGRLAFPNIRLPDAIYENRALRGNPFESAIADRTIELWSILDNYMSLRNHDGSDSDRSNEMIANYFTGSSSSKIPFTGESESNKTAFHDDLMFPDPDGAESIFAHWHGKINHRTFRFHFEWPVPRERKKLTVLYLGPKITTD